jgi:hypothetical protein
MAGGSKDEELEVGVSGGGTPDPTTTPQNICVSTNRSKISHLFAYQAEQALRLFTEANSLRKVRKPARASGLELSQGRGVRISHTLEYLHRGMPLDVVRAKGRWAGDFLLLDLRKNDVAMALYIQGSPAMNRAHGTPCPGLTTTATFGQPLRALPRNPAASLFLRGPEVPRLARRPNWFLAGVRPSY